MLWLSKMPDGRSVKWPAGSPFSQEQVHGPAPSNVRPFATAVLDKDFIVATAGNQGIGKDSKLSVVQSSLRQAARLVDRFREARDDAVVPVEDGGWKCLRGRRESGHRDSHNVTEEATLFPEF